MRKRWKDLTDEERQARKRRARPMFIVFVATCAVLAAVLLLARP